MYAGTFRILHISDVHYGDHTGVEEGDGSCMNIRADQFPCTGRNSTAFLEWLIAVEEPDLIVFTGDIIDWSTISAERGMNE